VPVSAWVTPGTTQAARTLVRATRADEMRSARSIASTAAIGVAALVVRRESADGRGLHDLGLSSRDASSVEATSTTPLRSRHDRAVTPHLGDRAHGLFEVAGGVDQADRSRLPTA